MRIAVVSGIFHPEPGGPSTSLFRLIPSLLARGHAVRVVTFGEADTAGYGYPIARISRRARYPAKLARFTWAVLRAARWADVMYVQTYPFPALVAYLLLRRPIVNKVVSDFTWEYARRHGLTGLDVVEFQPARHPWTLRLLRALYFRTLGVSRAVIVPSEHMARLVRGWGIPADRVQVVYNAIPDPRLSTADRAALRRELGLAPDRFTAVSVGRLTAVKGVDVALRALREVPDVDFVVVGDGEQQDELDALAADLGDRVIFAGYQPHDTALKFIRAADLFVLSSHTEGLSHVLLEALAVGTPAVATTVGGNVEVIRDGVSGLLVPPDDPPALAAAIARVRSDPDLAARLAEGGLARSVDFAWDTMVARTEALLQAACAPRAR